MPKTGKATTTKTKNSEPAKEVVPDYSVIVGLAKERTKVGGDFGSMTIAEIARKHREVAADLDLNKAELELLKAAGVKLLVKANVKSVLVDELPVTRVDGMNVSISRGRLVEVGVDEKLIDKATKRTPFTTLLVKAPGIE